MNIVWTAMAVVFPVMVLQRYGDHPEILGWIFASFGAGSVIGAVGSYRIIGRFDRLVLASTASSDRPRRCGSCSPTCRGRSCGLRGVAGSSSRC